MTNCSELLFHDEARVKLLRGASTLADAVRGTLGPEARSVIIERKFGAPLVCDDGVTIAKQITLKDRFENLGAQLLKEASVQTNDAVGDGTTTSTLLAHAMFAEGLRSVLVGVSAVELRKGMKRGSVAAVEALRAMARPVKDQADTGPGGSRSADRPQRRSGRGAGGREGSGGCRLLRVRRTLAGVRRA